MFGGGSGSGSAGGGGGGGRDNNEALNRLTHMMMMSSPPPQPVMVVGDADEYSKRDDRVPMWSHQETSDFIAIRGELESEFTVAKRNKSLWEVVAVKMNELGYRRTPDQCKCKWKNLVSRYKGKETLDQDNTRSFPFFEQLHTLFTEKAINTPTAQTPFDPEPTSTQSKSKKRVITRTDSYQSLKEISEDEFNDDDKNITKITIPPRKKPPTPKPGNSSTNPIREILHDFFQQQQMIDMQWRQLMEKHAYERQLFEQEWRQSMERIEIEKMKTEQLWREKEEQRRVREESRAERRDALLTLLLNKLVHEQ